MLSIHTHTYTQVLVKLEKRSMRSTQLTNMKNKVRYNFEGILYLLNSSC